MKIREEQKLNFNRQRSSYQIKNKFAIKGSKLNEDYNLPINGRVSSNADNKSSFTPINSKGYINEWGAMMKLIDDELEDREIKEKEQQKEKQIQYRLALKNQIKANIHKNKIGKGDQNTNFDVKNDEHIQTPKELFHRLSPAQEKVNDIRKKSKEVDIARHNLDISSVRQNIKRRNIVEEDNYIK